MDRVAEKREAAETTEGQEERSEQGQPEVGAVSHQRRRRDWDEGQFEQLSFPECILAMSRFCFLAVSSEIGSF